VKPEQEARLKAASDLVARTGARSLAIRYSEPDEGDDGPIVWIAIAEFSRPKGAVSQVGAALSPVEAIHRLLDSLIDGGLCKRCGRATAFDGENMLRKGRLPDVIEGIPTCWITYDDDAEKYVRDCERPASDRYVPPV